MTAKHRARPLLTKPEDTVVCVGPALVPAPQPVSTRPVSPSLRAAPLGTEANPRRFARVPTHAVGVHPEQREYPRATLKLPLIFPTAPILAVLESTCDCRRLSRLTPTPGFC